jgi:hypothetical protein
MEAGRNMKIWVAFLSALLLGACAAYNGYGLKPGVDRLENVLHVMGQPAMRWENPDGSMRLAYPRGPAGFRTYMITIGSDGRLRQIENVMDQNNFSRINPGMTREEVLYVLGPSNSAWTVYFKSRDELVWEWRYCAWNEAARFDVLFDNGKGTVRKTMSQTESLMGLCGRGRGSCFC